MAKQKQAGYKKFMSVIYLGLSAVLIYMLVINGQRVYKQVQDTKALQKHKEELVAEKEKLAKEVKLLNDDDYVTRYARDNYIFSKDGEEVVKLPDSKE